MTKVRYRSSTVRAILLATVLLPAPLLAEPAATARQMLTQAQAQAQDHAAKSEFKKITERGPVWRETPALKSFSSNQQEPVAIPAIGAEAKSEPPSEPMLGALQADGISVEQASPAAPQFASPAPAYQIASIAPSETLQGQVSTSSVVTSSAPETAADTGHVAAPVVATIVATTTSHDTPGIAPAPETRLPTIKTELAKSDRPTSEGDTIPARTKTGSQTGPNVVRKNEVAVKPAAKKATASTRISSSSSDMHQRHTRTNSAVEIAGGNIRPQLQRIMNRPDVRSLMAQYGLN